MRQTIAQKIIEENKRVYNSIAEQFSHTRRHPWGEFTLLRAYVKSGDSVLDIGCGNGRLATFLEDLDVHYTGVDASDKLVTIAKREHPTYTFTTATADQLPFPDQQFEVVCLIATLHHIPSHDLRQRVIHETARVLKPGGYLIMTEWNLWHPQWWGLITKYSLQKLLGLSRLDWGDIEKPWKNTQGKIMGYRYLHPFTQHALTRLIQCAGFDMIEQRYTTKGKTANWYHGYNLFSVAKKY